MIEEKVGWRKSDRVNEPCFDLLGRLQRAIRKNVTDVDGLAAKMTADEHGTMTRDRVLLRAEKADPIGDQETPNLSESLTERRKSPNQIVPRLVPAVALTFRTPCAEFPTEEDVTYSVVRECLRKCLAVELCVKTAVRLGPDIAHDVNAVPRQ